MQFFNVAYRFLKERFKLIRNFKIYFCMFVKINIVITESLLSKSCINRRCCKCKDNGSAFASRVIGQDHKLTSVELVDCVQEYLT